MTLHRTDAAGMDPGRGKLLYQDLTREIIGAAIEVHRAIGPGLLETVYEECLCHELGLRGLRFERQVLVPVIYKNVQLDNGHRLDIIVEDTVILEIKSVERPHPESRNCQEGFMTVLFSVPQCLRGRCLA